MNKQETKPSVIKLIEKLGAIHSIYQYAVAVISESEITKVLSEMISKKHLQLEELRRVFSVQEDSHSYYIGFSDFRKSIILGEDLLILEYCIEKEIELGQQYHTVIEATDNPVGKFMLKNHTQDNASLLKQLYQLNHHLSILSSH